MIIKESPVAVPPAICPDRLALAARIQPAYLRAVVDAVSVPRHYEKNREGNQAVGRWIENEFQSMGLATFRQGAFDNIVATSTGDMHRVEVLIAAHYDGVPDIAAADDNGSALAAMLGAARALADAGGLHGIGFVAFNREEDGLLGSNDFVQHYLARMPHAIRQVHVLEMVGYTDSEPGSQRVPSGLPVRVRDTGDFIGIVTNRESNHLADSIVGMATAYTPELPVASLRTFLGTERYFPQLWRSDHAPFWDAQLPAVMWTDTSEFRNPNYHLPSDTPDTLDYPFLAEVTRLLAVTAATQARMA